MANALEWWPILNKWNALIAMIVHHHALQSGPVEDDFAGLTGAHGLEALQVLLHREVVRDDRLDV
jgi:hypothetical protein